MENKLSYEWVLEIGRQVRDDYEPIHYENDKLDIHHHTINWDEDCLALTRIIWNEDGIVSRHYAYVDPINKTFINDTFDPDWIAELINPDQENDPIKIPEEYIHELARQVKRLWLQ